MSSAHYQVNWKTPALLALTLGAVSSAVYWYEYSKKPQEEKQAEQEKRVLRLQDQSIASVRLVDGARIYQFKCLDTEATKCKPGDNARWEVTEPSRLKADDTNINSLVSALNNLRPNEVIDLAEDTPEKRTSLLNQTRLDDAAIQAPQYRRIEVTLKSGEKKTLFFGDAHPFGEALYARSSVGPQDKLLLLPSFSKNHFDRDLTYWRDKKILTVTPVQVKKFTLKGSAESIAAERKDGQWVLSAGGETLPGDIEAVDSLLNSLSHLNAKAFASEQKTSPDAQNRTKGAKPAVSVSLTLANTPEPVVFTLLEKKFPAAKKGAPQPSIAFATVSNLDPLYEVDSASVPRLDKKLKELRLSKLITSTDRFSVRKLKLSGGPLGNTPLLLSQKEANWVNDSGKKIDSKKVSDLLDRLSGNRIQEFVALSSPPPAPGTLTVDLMNEKGESRRQLAFWKEGETLWGRDLSSKRKEKLKIDPTVKDVLPWSESAFDVAAPLPQATPPVGSKK